MVLPEAGETIVTAAGEALENISKLKFGALAKSVFSVRLQVGSWPRLSEHERYSPGPIPAEGAGRLLWCKDRVLTTLLVTDV